MKDSIMSQQIIYNLEEFATKYHLKDIFGAYAAYLSICGEESAEMADVDSSHDGRFHNMVEDRSLFTKLLLIKKGSCQFNMEDTGSNLDLRLKAKDLLIVTPKEIGKITGVSPDFRAESILVDEDFSREATLYQLSEEKYESISDTFRFVRDIVRRQHINKIELIRSMFNVLKLIIEELPYEECSVSHDLGHKKEVYEIFLHHLYRNFSKQRQIRFYADKLNVTSAYLSRLVKEISGSTVNDHVTSLLYKEICNLLKQTNMTIGEIADHLNFNDQSALTKFFKMRSGMTPLAYRNKQVH